MSKIKCPVAVNLNPAVNHANPSIVGVAPLLNPVASLAVPQNPARLIATLAIPTIPTLTGTNKVYKEENLTVSTFIDKFNTFISLLF